jgi:hypothetical protein
MRCLLVVVFPGVNVPSAGLALLVVAILSGTAAAYYVPHGLLVPVRLASSALRGCLDSGRVRDPSMSFTDQSGTLLADVQ